MNVLSYPLEIITDPLTGEADTVRTEVYSLDIVSPTNEASSDFAKQLLTVLGTLVIAVCSFYFGSRSTEQGSVMASEIINGSVIAAEQAKAPASPKLVPEQIIAEAIKQNKASWLTVYRVSDILVGKKKSGETVSFVNCIQFVVPNKDLIADGAKIIPSTIKYTASNGEVYDIPTDVVSA